MNEVVSGFPHTRKLKWINDLDVKSKTVKFYESTEMVFICPQIWQWVPSRDQRHEENIDKLKFIRTKWFVQRKNHLMKKYLPITELMRVCTHNVYVIPTRRKRLDNEQSCTFANGQTHQHWGTKQNHNESPRHHPDRQHYKAQTRVDKDEGRKITSSK